MSTILGTTPAEPGPARRPRRGDAERILAAELLDAFRAMAQSSTAFNERLEGRIVNHVLQVETCVVDPAGTPIARQWSAAAGCIELTNPDLLETITVHAAGPGAGAPSAGVGVYRVPPASTRVVAVASRQVTFYAAAGTTFSYQAFTAVPTPAVI